MDYRNAFAFVAKDKDWLKKVIVAVLLSFFSFLLIPVIILNGYLIEVTQMVIENETGLPKWSNWRRQFKKGLHLLVAVFVYISPGALIALTGLSENEFLLVILGYIGIFMPVVIIQYARTERIKSVFNLREFWRIVNKKQFLIVVLLGLMVIAAGSLTRELLVSFAEKLIDSSIVNLIVNHLVIALFPGVYASFVLSNLYGQVVVSQDETGDQ